MVEGLSTKLLTVDAVEEASVGFLTVEEAAPSTAIASTEEPCARLPTAASTIFFLAEASSGTSPQMVVSHDLGGGAAMEEVEGEFDDAVEASS